MNNLIYDLGMNNGDDTHYYLLRGFDVIAIEANPDLCTSAMLRFKNEIESGRLKILNVAIADKSGDCTFYINLENNHWSSLDYTWATRNNTSVRPCTINGLNLKEILGVYGIPHYLKIDIEGGDMLALRQLLDCRFPPNFLSVEDCRFGFDYLNVLKQLGYKRFKLSNQYLVPSQRDKHLSFEFMPGTSGMFGDDLIGDWLQYNDFLIYYESEVRDRQTLKKRGDQKIWWDIHCALN